MFQAYWVYFQLDRARTMDPKDWRWRLVDVFLVPVMKDKETAQNELLKIYDSTVERYLCTYLLTYVEKSVQ